MAELNLLNRLGVRQLGAQVLIPATRQRLSSDQALVHAAWLVAVADVADPGSKPFVDVLDDVACSLHAPSAETRNCCAVQLEGAALRVRKPQHRLTALQAKTHAAWLVMMAGAVDRYDRSFEDILEAVRRGD